MKQITREQVQSWLDKRTVELAEGSARTAHLKHSYAFKLGVLEETFASLLINPHQLRELVREIASVKADNAERGA